MKLARSFRSIDMVHGTRGTSIFEIVNIIQMGVAYVGFFTLVFVTSIHNFFLPQQVKDSNVDELG